MSDERLTPKQAAFVNHYIICMNGTEAARLSSYSGDDNALAVIASQNLRNPKILRAIQTKLEQNAMPSNEVLIRLTDMARGDIGDVLDDNGNLDLKKARQLKRTGLIKRVKQKVISTEDNEIFETEVELYDGQSALNTLMKYYGLLIDRTKVEDWRSQAIEDIKAGRLSFEALQSAFDKSLAAELFNLAGVPVSNDSTIVSD